MKSKNASPEMLSERELFTEYIELLDQEPPDNGYQVMKFNERRAQLLAEIGERLEALEATKSLLKTTDMKSDTQESSHNYLDSSTNTVNSGDLI